MQERSASVTIYSECFRACKALLRQLTHLQEWFVTANLFEIRRGCDPLLQAHAVVQERIAPATLHETCLISRSALQARFMLLQDQSGLVIPAQAGIQENYHRC